LIRDFDEACPHPPDDPLACVLGRLDIPRQGYDDDLLLDFYQRFTAVQEGVPIPVRLNAEAKDLFVGLVSEDGTVEGDGGS
jgi:hypothetical protein